MARWSVYASAGVLLFGAMACLVGAAGEWSDRSAMVDSNPAEAAEQAAFTAQLYGIAALYLASSLALLLVRSIWMWWSVLAVQAALFVSVIVEGLFTEDRLGWWTFSGLPLATLLLLVVIRIGQANLQRNFPHFKSIPKPGAS